MNIGDKDRRPPSGGQYAIAHDGAQAVITEVGATLRSYTAEGLDLVDGFAIDERAVDGRGQVLAPWPNRLTDGAYRYGDHECQAPLTEPSRHGAIHGLVRWLDWSLVSQDSASVSLSCSVRPQPGYEWQIELRVTYALDANGLTVTTSAVNLGSERAPFGVGFHPYLTVGATTIDGLLLTVPATTHLAHEGNEVGPAMVPVAGTSWDFTESRRIGSTRLDTAFGGLVRDARGLAVALLEDAEGGRAVDLWVDESYRYLMVYTGDRVGRPERRRKAVAVEPMTCPPDALRTGTDLIQLDPGETWEGGWGLRPARAGTTSARTGPPR